MPTLEDVDAPVAPSTDQQGIGEAENFANTQGANTQGDSGGVEETSDKLESAIGGAPARLGKAIGGTGIAGKIKNAKRIKRILMVGGPIIGVIAAVAPILFFLMLFQSVHIKHLFIDYEFAKFNRAFTRSLDKAVREAKANGKTADIPADADPMTQLEGVSADKINELKGNSSALTEEADKARTLMQADVGPDSPGATVDTEFSIDRSVAPEDPKLSADDAEKARTKQINTDTEGQNSSVDPPEPVKDAVEKAKEDGAAGKSVEEIKANAAKNVGSKLSGLSGKASAVLFIATFGCIAQDIFVSSVKLFSKIKLAALARFAATIAKQADCQQVGACGLDNAGAVSKLFNSGGQSYTQSAGYQRASGKPVTAAGTANDLDPAMTPTNNGSGLTDQIIHVASVVSDYTGAPCKVILTPAFQVLATGVLVIAQVVLYVSGAVDFGLSDIVAAAAGGAATIVATKVGKALAADAVLHYSGLVFHGPFTPIQAGNMMDAGSKALANATFISAGGRKLSAAENQQLAQDIYHDQVVNARKQGLAYQLFSPENPYSVASLAVDQVPFTVGTAVSKFNTALATCFNPARFITSLARIGFSSPAYAAATAESNTYGQPDIGLPDSVIDKWTIADNTNWVKINILPYPDVKSKYDKCISTEYSDRVTSGDTSYCDDPNDVTAQHYAAYKLAQLSTHSLVYLNNTASHSNNNSNNGGGGGGQASSCGNAQDCAQKLLQDTHVTYSTQFGDVRGDVQSTANDIPITACSPATELSPTMMAVVLQASTKYDIDISTFITGHHCSAGKYAHASGRAFDVDRINGKAAFSDINLTVEFVKYIATIVPDGAGIGQSTCQGIKDISFPSTVVPREDACTHIHVDMGDKAP
jgi:hypothetical protein